MSGGAAAEPRLYDEFASKGTPNSVGAPHGNFPLGVLDMELTSNAPIPYTLLASLRSPANCSLNTMKYKTGASR